MSFPLSRRFLLLQNDSQPPAAAADSSAAEGSATFNPTTPFDSSMALTILVLLTALFFMGFFSVYIRRFTVSAEDSSPAPSSAALRRPQDNKRGGLDPSAVSSLPLATYGGGKVAKHPMIDDCPICLGEFRDGDTVKVIPYCGHVFHPKCVDTWLSSHVTCPMCRSAQLFQSVPEVCLDVKGERSTVGDGDTCRVEISGGVRRACSCTQLANRTVLQRTASF